jgi:CelD/BcsL family acetyltransferase involved in cellulose biosynthesis
MTTLRINWLSQSAQVLKHDADLHREWDRLNTARGDLPFLSADATESALTVFGTGKECLLVGRQNGAIVAMFVLAPAGKMRWQTFQPSQIPLGAWVAEPQFAIDDLARSLIRGPLGLCLVLSITQIDPLFAERAPDAEDCRHDDYIDTGWIDIRGSFEDYWAARGKNLRQNMRKQRAKLLADGIATTMRVTRDPADMPRAIAEYGRLESSGWKAEKGTAIHPDNDQGRFYLALLGKAALRGEAVVYEYQFDDRVVAMNLCLERHGNLVVLKTTYDESIKNFSPAFLLRQDELEMLHRTGETHRLEYYGRLMEWHTRWTDNKRGIYHLTMYRWPLLKRLAARRQEAASQGAAAAPATPTDQSSEVQP